MSKSQAGKGDKPRYDFKKYTESKLWDNFGPDKKKKSRISKQK